MSEKFDLADNNYLSDKVREMYAKTIVFRNLLIAARCLKPLYNKDDRRIILIALSVFSQELIDKIYYEDDYKFSNNDVKRLVDFTMEMLFHKIVSLFKSGIEEELWGDALNMVVNAAFFTEREFIISKDSIKDSYVYSKFNVDKCFKENICELLEKKQIDKKQLKLALNKSYITYLKHKIMNNNDCDRTKKIKFSVIIFIICWIGFKLILYFLRTH